MKEIKKNKIRENDTEERDNVGVIAKDILSKDAQIIDARDTSHDRESRYISKLVEAVKDGKKSYPHKDLFIQVITRKPKVLLGTTIDNRFVVRTTCPMPNFEQSVFHYEHKTDDVHLLWTLPSKEISHELRKNALIIDPSIRESTRYAIDFFDGALDRLCKKLNKEDVLEGNIILEVKNG